MMKMMNKKISSFLLILVVIFNVFLCVSCAEKNREYDENKVLEVAKELIPKSVLLNELFYGYGIAPDLSSTKFNGVYYEADYISVLDFGIKSVDEMKTLTRECFSFEYSELIIRTKLSSIMDENGTPISLVRYYQDTADTDVIMVNKDTDIFLKDKLEYDYNSIKVTHSKGEEVFVTIGVKVTNDEGKVQNKTLEVALIEESDGWRINSPTYTTYFDRSAYDDLENK